MAVPGRPAPPAPMVAWSWRSRNTHFATVPATTRAPLTGRIFRPLFTLSSRAGASWSPGSAARQAPHRKFALDFWGAARVTVATMPDPAGFASATSAPPLAAFVAARTALPLNPVPERVVCGVPAGSRLNPRTRCPAWPWGAATTTPSTIGPQNLPPRPGTGTWNGDPLAALTNATKFGGAAITMRLTMGAPWPSGCDWAPAICPRSTSARTYILGPLSKEVHDPAHDE